MVDIPLPRISRERQETPISPGRLETPAPIDNNSKTQAAIGEVVNSGVKYFERQAEASANDYAKDAFLKLRDEFNLGFNSGEGENLGLRNIEGYEQFVEGRNKLTEKLNKKREELLTKDGLSGFARERAAQKLDEAMSTFRYYMDTQEGQVKIADRSKKTALTIQAKAEDLNNILANGFDPKDEGSLKVLELSLKDIRNTLYDAMVDSGTATKEVSSDGTPKYKVSSLGQFEVQKAMSKMVSDFTENIAAQPDGPERAKAILENFGDYVLPGTKTRIEKYITERSRNNQAYKIVNELVNMKDGSSDDYKAKVDELIADGQIELAEKVERLYPTMLEKRRSIKRNISRGYADTAFDMIREKGFTTLADAEQDPEFLKVYNGIEDAGVKKTVDSFFNPPKVSSYEALEKMELFIASGVKDDKAYMKIHALLNAKDRKTYGTMYTGFGGIDSDGKKVKMTRSYLTEGTKLLVANGIIDPNYKYNEDDLKVISDFKSKLISSFEKESSIPDPFNSAGEKYLNDAVQAFIDDPENPLPKPNFKGERKQVSTGDAALTEKYYRKFGRSPSPAELDLAKKGTFKDLRTGRVK